MLRIHSTAYAIDDAVSHQARRSSGTQAFKRSSKDRGSIETGKISGFPPAFVSLQRLRPRARRSLFDPPLSGGRDRLLGPAKLGSIEPHAVQHGGETAGDGHTGALEPALLGEAEAQALSQDGALVLVSSAMEAS